VAETLSFEGVSHGSRRRMEMAGDVLANPECEQFESAIQILLEEIPQLEKRVQALQSLLKWLQSRPNPDGAQIQQVTVELRLRSEELERAQAQLVGFQALFDEVCGTHS
jgi:hypothetical protein